jgi:hypothetical protein
MLKKSQPRFAYCTPYNYITFPSPSASKIDNMAAKRATLVLLLYASCSKATQSFTWPNQTAQCGVSVP